MADVAAAVGNARSYFETWAGAMVKEQRLLPQAIEYDDPLPSETMHFLFGNSTLRDPTKVDGARASGVAAVSSPAFAAKLEEFTTNEQSARGRFGELRELVGEMRNVVLGNEEIVSLLIRGYFGEPRELDTKIAEYVLADGAWTRLGDRVARPEADAEDAPLLSLLRLLRIVGEHVFDDRFDLPWYAQDNSPEAQRFLKWEKSAGAAGEAIGQAVGRAAAVSATGLIGAFVKLPDELTIGLSYVAGVVARKKAEQEMHQYLEENPNLGQD